MSQYITTEGHIVIKKLLATTPVVSVYVEGHFTNTGRWVIDAEHDTVQPQWESVDHLLTEVNRLAEKSDEVFRKGYQAGVNYVQRGTPRPVDDGESLLWRDEYGNLIVRNNNGRAYSCLQWNGNSGETWHWAANMDDLPEGAIPLYDPTNAPSVPDFLPKVNVWQENGHWIADGEPGDLEDHTVDMTNRHDLENPEMLDISIAYAKWNLAALLRLQELEGLRKAEEVKEIARWVLTAPDVDLDSFGAIKIASVLADRYEMKEKDE